MALFKTSSALHKPYGGFMGMVADLPKEVQEHARRVYDAMERDINSVELKPINRYKQWNQNVYSVRINDRYRALAMRVNGVFYWYWIGPHREYDKQISSKYPPSLPERLKRPSGPSPLPVLPGAKNLVNPPQQVGQRRSFLNWYKRMKIADAWYHGTGNEESIRQRGFVKDYIGQGNEQYGPGFYFTNRLETAQGYTSGPQWHNEEGGKVGGDKVPGIVEVQLNIRNPIKVNSQSSARTAPGGQINGFAAYPVLNRAQAKTMIEAAVRQFGAEVLEDYGDIEYEGIRKVIGDVISNYEGSSSLMMIYDFFKQDLISGLRLLSKLTGYDGLMVDFGTGEIHAVAWFPEQIQILGKGQNS